MTAIKSMGLYRNVDRIDADLRSNGITANANLRVDQLTPYDQYHYEGTDAVDDAIEFLGASRESNILDIGSGLGGPARYIADRTGATVTALEIQPDLHATAAHLTERCQLSGRVNHLHGDILADDAPPETFDGIVSMLCFLHIPDRAALFAACARAIKPTGRMFIDDFVALAPTTETERQNLADTVFCSHLPDEQTYRSDVEAAGFVGVQCVNKSDAWTEFVNDRYQLFSGASSELSARYGAETVADLDHFYSTVAALFTNGNVGGLRLTAQLPA
jgi:sarcosine/dimethylglycine N-methyltransferase